MRIRFKSTLGCLLALLLCFGLWVPVAQAAQIQAQSSPAAMTTGGEVTFSITITNDGEAVMENVQISSAYSGIAFDGVGASIDPGAEKTFSATVIISEAALDQPISFDLNWLENGELRSDSTAITIQRQAAAVLSGSVSVDKTQASQGETVNITYTLTNSGMTPVSVVSLADKEISSKPIAENVVVDPGAPLVLTYEFTMGSATVTSAPVITYDDGLGNTQTLKLKETTLGMVMNKLSMEVTQGEGTVNGVPFTLNLTNNGNQRISDIQVTDELGNKVNDGTFALAVGETRQLSYTVLTDTERYVVFHVSGESASGEKYENNTKSFVVRKYIDPALLGIDFSAAVLEPLNSAGSITVRFTINNTGSLDMTDLVISEKTQGTDEEGNPTDVLTEITRKDVVGPGEFSSDQVIFVGQPRELVFQLDMTDPAGNPYTYTAHITGDSIGVYDPADAEEAQQDVIQALGVQIGTGISRALSVALIVLAVLIVLAIIALIVLRRLERQQRREAARRRARRERQRQELLRQQQADQDTLTGRPSQPLRQQEDLGQTQIHHRPRDFEP